MNKYRGKSFDGLFPSSRDPEVVEGSFEGGLSLERSAQDIALNLSPAHDRVRVERGALRQDYWFRNLGLPAAARILALGENRFVRAGFVLFEKTFRLYRSPAGYPIIESWNEVTEVWVFEATTDEFAIEDVLLGWKPYFNSVFFADGARVFKWDNADLIDDEGNDFPASNLIGGYGSTATSATISPAGGTSDQYRVHYSLRIRGINVAEGSVNIQAIVNGQVVAEKTRPIPVNLDDVDFETLYDHETLEFTEAIVDGTSVVLAVSEISAFPWVDATQEFTVQASNIEALLTYVLFKSVANTYTVNFDLEVLLGVGTTGVRIAVNYGAGFVTLHEDQYADGTHSVDVTVTDRPVAFQILLYEEVDDTDWALNNAPDSNTLVRDETVLVEVHGFNEATNFDPTNGVTYSTVGAIKNEIVLVRENGESGEIIVGRFLGIFADRVCVLISDGDQQKIRWCVRGDPTDWLGNGSGENIIPSNSDPVDTLQALEPLTSDMAVLFRQRSKMRVHETGQLEPALAFFDWIEKIGTESPFSVIAVPDGIMYFASNKQTYFLTEGGEVQVGEKIREELLYNLPDLESVEAVYKPDQQEYIITMAHGEEEEPAISIDEGIVLEESVELNEPPGVFRFDIVVFPDLHSCTQTTDNSGGTVVRMVDVVACNAPECGGSGGWLAWFSNDPTDDPSDPDNPLLPYYP